MDPRLKLLLLLIALGVVGLAFWGLLVWMERRGWVRLRGGARGVGAGLTAVQEVYDPPARQVVVVRENGPRRSETGDPPPSDHHSIRPSPGGGS
jgi:hypothetical protein